MALEDQDYLSLNSSVDNLTRIYKRYRDLKFLFNTWKNNDFNSNLNMRDVTKLMLVKCITHASKFDYKNIFDEYTNETSSHHSLIIKILNLSN